MTTLLVPLVNDNKITILQSSLSISSWYQYRNGFDSSRRCFLKFRTLNFSSKFISSWVGEVRGVVPNYKNFELRLVDVVFSQHYDAYYFLRMPDSSCRNKTVRFGTFV